MQMYHNAMFGRENASHIQNRTTCGQKSFILAHYIETKPKTTFNFFCLTYSSPIPIINFLPFSKISFRKLCQKIEILF